MKTYNKHFIVVVAICLMGASLQFASAGAAGQTGLPQTSFKQWSKDEVNRLLERSPWAQTKEERRPAPDVRARTVAGQNINGVATTTAERQANLGGANIPLDLKYTVRLRSAIPLRQAALRLKQIDAKYDRMGKKAQSEFDAANKGVLACPACAQNYVITMSAKSENYPYIDPVYEVLKSATLPAIKPYVYITNDRGVRRELIHFNAPRAAGEEAYFFFPRFDASGDQPFILPTDKSLRFHLGDGSAGSLVNFEFDVRQLIIDGQVAF